MRFRVRLRGDACDHSRSMRVDIRYATEDDQAEIRTLVLSEPLNPNDLDWRRFVVAAEGPRVIGAVQLREHFDGSRELGSLVVRKDARQRGIAARLIDAMLATARTRVFMITGAAFAAHYARWGFRRIAALDASLSVRINYCIGQTACLLSLLSFRRPKRLVVLHRGTGPVPS